MKATPELITKAKQLSQDNYESWGQWVVECFTDEELAEDLADFNSLKEWIDVRISVANVISEREDW